MRNMLTRLFLAAEAVLYLWFLLLDVTHTPGSTPVKYAALLLCVVFALGSLSDADGRITALALLFTAGADWFLLVRGEHTVSGLLLFCAVQLLYALRLFFLRGRQLSALDVFRLAALAAFLCGDTLVGLAAFYFLNLLLNTIEALLLYRTDARARVFLCGLALFVCCDVCVGLWNLGLAVWFTRVAMWLFYLPSQVLIVLSTRAKGEADAKTV